jgi:hypothetical protein
MVYLIRRSILVSGYAEQLLIIMKIKFFQHLCILYYYKCQVRAFCTAVSAQHDIFQQRAYDINLKHPSNTTTLWYLISDRVQKLKYDASPVIMKLI